MKSDNPVKKTKKKSQKMLPETNTDQEQSKKPKSKKILQDENEVTKTNEVKSKESKKLSPVPSKPQTNEKLMSQKVKKNTGSLEKIKKKRASMVLNDESSNKKSKK